MSSCCFCLYLTRSQASGFLVGLATDYFSKRMEQNEAVRAAQLKELITSLGPVFIKVPGHPHTIGLFPARPGPSYPPCACLLTASSRGSCCRWGS